MSSLSSIDATYQVTMDARPSNYGVTHISWGSFAPDLNWLNLYLVRSTTGYPQNPSDGAQIYSTNTNDVIVKVTGVTASTGAVSAYNVNYAGISATNNLPGGKNTVYSVPMTSFVSPYALMPTKGQGLQAETFGSGFTITSLGTGFSPYDYARIPATSFSGVTATTTELGIKNAYHVYDNGSGLASTLNPGYGVTGADLNAPKYYYSLFVSYYDTNDGTNISPTMNQKWKYVKWKKVGEISSDVVQTTRVVDDSGTVLVKGTKDIIFDHLPKFYLRNLDESTNKDLEDFLSLFAFHLDSYIQKNKNIFELTNTATIDETLLKRLLYQVGARYTGTSNLTQARKLVQNIVRSFKLNGSTVGLSNYLETHSGYAVKAVAPKNLLFDYNTSSFAENVGRWYPDPAVAGGFSTTPYTYVGDTNSSAAAVLRVGDLNGAYLYTSNIESYNNTLDYVAYSSLEGTRYANTLTTCTNSGTLVTCDDTSKLYQGAKLVAIEGPGMLSPGAVVTVVNSPTTFTLNSAPLIALYDGNSYTKFAVANNLTSPMLKITPSTVNATATFYSGVRKAVTDGATATSSLPIMKPFVEKVGDFVTGHPFIPVNTYITRINDSNQSVLSNKLTGSIPIGTTLYFTRSTNKSYTTYSSGVGKTTLNVEGGSTNVSTDSAVDSYLVNPNTPYGFVVHFNANGSTPATTTVNLTWYNNNGDVISTSTATTAAPTATSPVANFNYKKTWYPSFVCDVSPATAAFVQPSFSITGVTNQYADAAMLTAPIAVKGASKTSGVVTITTATPHNFYVGQKVSVYTSVTTTNKYNTPVGSPATITVVSQDLKTKVYTFSYSLGSGSASDVTATGYCASLPGADITYNPQYVITAAARQTVPTGVNSTTATIASGSTTITASSGATITAAVGCLIQQANIPANTYVLTASNTTKIMTISQATTGPIAGSSALTFSKTRYTSEGAVNMDVGQPVTIANVTGATGSGDFSGSFVVTAIQTSPNSFDATATATAGTAVVSSTSTATLSVTNRQTLFEDARVNRLEIQASRINLCPTPNFETVTGWKSTDSGLLGVVATTQNQYYSSYSSAQVQYAANTAAGEGIYYAGYAASFGTTQDIKVEGSLSANKTINVNGTNVSISGNNYYAFSAYVRSAEAASFRIEVDWYGALGNNIGSTVTGTTTLLNANEWTRVSLSQDIDGDKAKAPVGAVSAVMFIIKTTVTGASSVYTYFDSVLVEKSQTVNDYFDGNFDGYSHEPTRDSMWESASGLSPSYLYPNRITGQSFIDIRTADMTYYG